MTLTPLGGVSSPTEVPLASSDLALDPDAFIELPVIAMDTTCAAAVAIQSPRRCPSSKTPATTANITSRSATVRPRTSRSAALATCGDGAAVTYAITGGNSAGLFAIDPNSGQITLAKNLKDAEDGRATSRTS